MADCMIPCCVKPRPIFSKIIDICTGKDLRFRKPSDAIIQVSLAEIAAIDWVGHVGRVGELPSVENV